MYNQIIFLITICFYIILLFTLKEIINYNKIMENDGIAYYLQNCIYQGPFIINETIFKWDNKLFLSFLKKNETILETSLFVENYKNINLEIIKYLNINNWKKNADFELNNENFKINVKFYNYVNDDWLNNNKIIDLNIKNLKNNTSNIKEKIHLNFKPQFKDVKIFIFFFNLLLIVIKIVKFSLINDTINLKIILGLDYFFFFDHIISSNLLLKEIFSYNKIIKFFSLNTNNFLSIILYSFYFLLAIFTIYYIIIMVLLFNKNNKKILWIPIFILNGIIFFIRNENFEGLYLLIGFNLIYLNLLLFYLSKIEKFNKYKLIICFSSQILENIIYILIFNKIIIFWIIVINILLKIIFWLIYFIKLDKKNCNYCLKKFKWNEKKVIIHKNCYDKINFKKIEKIENIGKIENLYLK